MDWVIGFLEALVMFLQDSVWSFILLFGVPLTALCYCRRFEDTLTPLVRRYYITAGFLLWVLLVVLRDFHPTPRMLWYAIGLFFWASAFYHIGYVEERGIVHSDEHNSTPAS